MASWAGFLLIYLMGGLTFLPLVLITVLLHAYLTFPNRDDLDQPKPDPANDIVQPGDDTTGLKAAQALHKEDSKAPSSQHDTEVAAGYFAVCREYTPMGINAKPIERPTPVGSARVAAPSQSVYQSMYRSIFDRKQTPSLFDHHKNMSQRPKKAGNVFYVVLRHGHLMLFDDDEQLEVRHVIPLAYHDISIYSGGDTTPEGELFIKRNAICLTRAMEGIETSPDTQLTKPFYLFSENCSAKEDFYFALLRNQEQTFGGENKAPKPVQFDIKNIISLVQKLHSSEEHLQTRWLNAMIGRVFLGVYQTTDIEHFVRAKLTKKISRVKRPSFLTGISIQKIDLGDSAPYFTNPRLKDLTVEGECGVEADVRYTGNFRIEVAATARIDLGTRFKAREVNLVLAVVLKKLEGHVLFKIKPPPSNRVWFSFQQMPKTEMVLEPIISSRQITYSVILRQIEHRIKEVVAETLVLPFWDDIPFFHTEHKRWRAGIWQGDDAVERNVDFEAAAAQLGKVDEVDRYEEGGLPSPDLPPVEKSHSVPVIDAPPTGLFGRRLNGKSPVPLKENSSSTAIDAKVASPRSRVSRSSSFVNPPIPTTGTDVTNADMFKPSSSPPNESPAADAMASLSARSQGNTQSQTPVDSPQQPPELSGSSGHSSTSSREATDTEKDVNEQTPKQPRRDTVSTISSAEAPTHEGDAPKKGSPAPSTKGSLRSQTGSITRGLFSRKDMSQNPLATADSSSESPKRSTLAAVTNVAASAKRWGISALQRNPDGKDSQPGDSSSNIDLTKPMGGGRPLPPPGVPLPGPDKRRGILPIPISRRKEPPPPLPDRPRAEEPVSERRPVPVPPLPKRRQMADSPPQGDGENILVVEAPTDSEPTTPSAEDHDAYVHPWAEDADDDDDDGDDEEVDEAGTQQAEVTPPAEPADLIDTPKHDIGEDDDDDISAWMDQEQLAEPGSSIITSEGNTLVL